MPFNNTRTLNFKAQPDKCNQVFRGPSQLPITAEHCFVVWTVHNDYSAVLGSWEELPNIWLTVAKNAFVGWALSFRVRLLLKGAVTILVSLWFIIISSVFFYLSKLLFSRFHQYNGNSLQRQFDITQYPLGGEIPDTKTLNLSPNISKFVEWQVVSLMKNEQQSQICFSK